LWARPAWGYQRWLRKCRAGGCLWFASGIIWDRRLHRAAHSRLGIGSHWRCGRNRHSADRVDRAVHAVPQNSLAEPRSWSLDRVQMGKLAPNRCAEPLPASFAKWSHCALSFPLAVPAGARVTHDRPPSLEDRPLRVRRSARLRQNFVY